MRIFKENGKMVVKPDGISDKWMFIDESVDLSKTYFFTPYNEYPDGNRANLNNVLPKGKPYGRSNIIQEYVNELGDEKILKYVPKSVLDGIYGLLEEFVKLVRDNPDDYSLMGASWKVRSLCPYYSHVGGVRYLRNWGIIIEMLALGGLFRWMWAFDIKPDDEGFNDINTFFKWIESFLYVSVETFCQFQPLNPDTDKMKDEERDLIYTTKQICQYMLRTSVGYGVQCRIRNYVLGDAYGNNHRSPALSYLTGILGAIPIGPFVYHPEDPYFLPQPEGFIDSPNYVPSYSFTPYPVVSTDKDEDEGEEEHQLKALPKELDTQEGRALLECLIDAGYCDKEYCWNSNKWRVGKHKFALACFVVEACKYLNLTEKVNPISNATSKSRMELEYVTIWKPFEDLFEFMGKKKNPPYNQLQQTMKDYRKRGDDIGNTVEMKEIKMFFENLPQQKT